MKVTITNPGSVEVYVSGFAVSIPAGGSVTTVRSSAQIEADVQLMGLLSAGTVTMTTEKETSDGASVIPTRVETYADIASLPAVATVPVGTFAFAIAEKKLVVADGAAWLATAALA